MSFSNYLETAVMDAVFNNASPAAIQLANRYVKLYIGDPGENGTANPAVETARQSATSAASVDGVFTSVNDLIWVGVAANETYTHVGIWDTVGPAGGNFLVGGALTAPVAVTVGNTFTIPTGSLTVTLT